MRPGIDLLEDVAGTGEAVRRHEYYFVKLRMWLNRGDALRWPYAWGTSPTRLEDDGTALFAYFRIDRESLISGLFYGIDGMSVGGRRKLRIAPHLAYRENGVPGAIPPNALLIAEIEILSRGLPG